MISESVVTDLLRNLKQQFPSPRILSIDDHSKGVDQQVKIVTLKVRNQQRKIVVKHPKEQPDKISNQLIGCTFSQAKEVPVPHIYFHNEHYLVESYLPGQSMLSLRTSKKNFKNIYHQLGLYLRRIHSNIGSGFGKLKSKKLKGQYPNKQHILNNIYHQIQTMKLSDHFAPSMVKQVEKYIKQNIDIINKSEKSTSLLHGDCSEDNIIANNKSIEGIVDFGDLNMGSPMEDFGRLYLQNYGTYKWQALIEGYGSHSLREIQFYTMYLSLWLMNSLVQKQQFRTRLRRLKRAVDLITRKQNNVAR